MSNTWDITILPIAEHEKAVNLFLNRQLDKLSDLFILHGVISCDVCAASSHQQIERWMRFWIHKKMISLDSNGFPFKDREPHDGGQASDFRDVRDSD